MWTTILEIVLKGMGWFLDWYGASQQSRQRFLDLVTSLKDEKKISIEAHDEFQKQQDKLKEKK